MERRARAGTARSVRAWAATLLLALLFVTIVSGAMRSAADTPVGPVFQSLSIASANVTTGNSVTVSARITDAYSDIAEQPSISYIQPNGTDDGPFAFFARVSGTPRDGMYEAVLTVSRFYPAGDYPVKEVRAFDLDGKLTSLVPPAPPTPNLLLHVARSTGQPSVTNAPTNAPTPTAIAMATAARPTSTARPATATFAPPPIATAGNTPRAAMPRNAAPNAPTATALPPAPTGGTVASATFREITVSDGSIVPPGRTIAVTVHLTSNVDILNYSTIAYAGPGGDGPFAYLTRVSGTPQDGIYRATLYLPRGAPTGSYTIRELRVTCTGGAEFVFTATMLGQSGAFTVKQ